LNKGALKNIPIPKHLDEYLVTEISKLSELLTAEKIVYKGEVKTKLNELIYDLYELSFYERQRVKDFFISEKTKLHKAGIEEYKQTLRDMFEMHFNAPPQIKDYIDNVFGSGITVVAIYFNGYKKPKVTPKKVLAYSISEEILKSGSKAFTLLQSKIVGKDCVYLIKNSFLNNWSITKAYEDAKGIIKLAK